MGLFGSTLRRVAADHAAPGTTFTLADHPEHDLDAPEQRQFLITAITHHARNNCVFRAIVTAVSPKRDRDFTKSVTV